MEYYEVYFDESGKFKSYEGLSLIGGFVYHVSEKQIGCQALRYKEIIMNCVQKINKKRNDWKQKRIIGLNIGRDLICPRELHTSECGFMKEVVQKTDVIEAEINKSIDRDAFSLVIAYGWPDEADPDEFLYENYYRHMLINLISTITSKLRSRHPNEDVKILFCIPTRQAEYERGKDDQAIKALTAVGAIDKATAESSASKIKTSVNYYQTFALVQEELGIECVCKTINYKQDSLDAESSMTKGSSWGYFLADWICSWLNLRVQSTERPGIIDPKSKKNPRFVGDVLNIGMEPIILVYNSNYRQYLEAKTSAPHNPKAFFELYEKLKNSEKFRDAWCREMMEKAHPFSDQKVFASTVDWITTNYNTSEHPYQTTAEQYYILLKKLIDESTQQPSAEAYAELCRQLMYCYQFRGANINAYKLFMTCANGRQIWSPIDKLDIMAIFSDTYANVLAFEEGRDMLDYALRTYRPNKDAESANRWMIVRQADENRSRYVVARAEMMLGRIFGFLNDENGEDYFQNAIYELIALGKFRDADEAVFHYIHFLLQVNENGNRDVEILKQLNAYIDTETRDDIVNQARDSELWLSWLERIIANRDNDGEEAVRFALWIYFKTLYYYLTKEGFIDEDSRITILLEIEKAEMREMIEKMIYYGTPAESIITYYGLLSALAGDPDYTSSISAIQWLNQIASDDPNNTIKLLCHVGAMRIRAVCNKKQPGSWQKVLHNDFLALQKDWIDIVPSTSTINSLYTDSNWDIDQVMEALTYEFY